LLHGFCWLEQSSFLYFVQQLGSLCIWACLLCEGGTCVGSLSWHGMDTCSRPKALQTGWQSVKECPQHTALLCAFVQYLLSEHVECLGFFIHEYLALFSEGEEWLPYPHKWQNSLIQELRM
jgi:hypothetical protein